MSMIVNEYSIRNEFNEVFLLLFKRILLNNTIDNK